MKTTPFYMTPAAMAELKEEAHRQGQRLRELRAKRETERLLAKSKLPALPVITLPAKW